MFESLSERLQSTIKKIKGYGKITENNISDMTRDIRLALLEADVNYKVVKEFVSKVKEKALGSEVMKSLTPGQMLVKIVKAELIELLGGEQAPLQVNQGRTITMMVGLQGSGKTTTAGKIASLVRKKNTVNPLLVACDVYRPAAIKQLQTIGRELNIEVYAEDTKDVKQIVSNALDYAREHNKDYIIIDTAGRLHIDEAMMNELITIEELVNPDEVLLVIDAMIGQDAVNVVSDFNNNLNLSGVVLTKLDGDTRGGAALSIRHITSIPIKLVGTGEKTKDIDYFYPERMASRILGMGDVLSIVEKAEEVIDEEQAKKTMKKMQTGKFDLQDFLEQLDQIKKLGPIENIIGMLPGANKLGLNKMNIDPKKLTHIEAIILSMTKIERENPSILKASRKQRIAKGSGRSVQEVNALLKQYEEMKKMMKMFKNNKFGGKMF